MRPSLKLLGVDKRWSAGRFVKIEDAAVPVAQSPSEQISTDVQAAIPRFEVIRRGGEWGVLDNQLQRVAKTSTRDAARRVLSACEQGTLASPKQVRREFYGSWCQYEWWNGGGWVRVKGRVSKVSGRPEA